jgi:hypothetical protein
VIVSEFAITLKPRGKPRFETVTPDISWPLNLISQSTATSAVVEYELLFCRVKHNNIAFALTDTGVNHNTTPDTETGWAFAIAAEAEPTLKVTV